ncbi:MAG: OmpA family protein [Acidobacteriota bacterium]|nr:OmpA family protein [Acidobacteriota bacterium]MDH3522638.1 OmpA family protein [Acidobacteriota bacterium]
MSGSRWAVAAAGLLLAGCAGRAVDVHFWDLDAPVLPLLGEPQAAAPEPRPITQYVVLLPDGDTVGAIEVSNGKTTATLTRAYEAVSFDDLARPYMLDPETVGRFPLVAAHLPPPPVGFTLLFELGSPRLDAEARALMPAVLAAILARSAPEVIVAGHADRAGGRDVNKRLSRERAEAVRDEIVAAGLAAGAVAVEWYGEERPAVDTPDGVREARNRRVEIRVR